MSQNKLNLKKVESQPLIKTANIKQLLIDINMY